MSIVLRFGVNLAPKLLVLPVTKISMHYIILMQIMQPCSQTLNDFALNFVQASIVSML